MKFEPRDYQLRIIEKQKADSSFIVAKMGCGKTSSTLQTIVNEVTSLQSIRILITAPLAVAKNVWPKEIQKFEDFSWLNVAVCVGTTKARLQALAKNATVTIINHDCLKWLQQELDGEIPFDFCIVDESSCFKNPSAIRFKVLKKFKPKIKKWTLLTGTPMTKSYMDLWSQMFLIDNGESLGKTITNYRTNYFNYNPYTHEYSPSISSKREIVTKVSKHSVVVNTYDSLPEKTDVTNYIMLPNFLQNRYETFKKESLLRIDENTISAVNAAVLVNKLQQFCCGAIYDEHNNVSIIHNEKINALKQLLVDLQDENVLVCYQYRHDFDRIKQAVSEAVCIKSEGAIDKWNAGKIKVLLAHSRSAGHGLNLQDGGNRIIWFTPNYSSELKEQFDARVRRQGQKNKVFIHTLVCSDTIDEDIISAQKAKQFSQVELLKNLIRRERNHGQR